MGPGVLGRLANLGLVDVDGPQGAQHQIVFNGDLACHLNCGSSQSRWELTDVGDRSLGRVATFVFIEEDHDHDFQMKSS